MNTMDRVLGGLWGALVGDALGVPVEFQSRSERQADPVTDMREFGTHRQPKGTWSDDGSLILCTVDSLLHAEFDPEDMGRRFVAWMNEGLWTANGEVFDVGAATTGALLRIAGGTPAEQAGGRDESCNGNGSLMRILPVALRFASQAPKTLVECLEKASSITHGHARSKMACALYGLISRNLLLGWKPQAALDATRVEFTGWYERAPEYSHFRHVLCDDFASLAEGSIASTGYVIHTLHASLWCMLTTASYEDCVLRAVNLGGDTDTTACVAGGLAGVHYGIGAVPERWRNVMARREAVGQLFDRFAGAVVAAGSK